MQHGTMTTLFISILVVINLKVSNPLPMTKITFSTSSICHVKIEKYTLRCRQRTSRNIYTYINIYIYYNVFTNIGSKVTMVLSLYCLSSSSLRLIAIAINNCPCQVSAIGTYSMPINYCKMMSLDWHPCYNSRWRQWAWWEGATPYHFIIDTNIHD